MSRFFLASLLALCLGGSFAFGGPEGGLRGSGGDCNSNGVMDEYETGPYAGYALLFNGKDQYVNLGASGDLTGLGQSSFTLEAWIKTPDQYRSIIIGNWNGNPSWNFEIHHTEPLGRLRLYISDGSTTEDHRGKTSIADNKWHHVAAVRSIPSGGGDGYVRLYIDGSLDYEGPSSLGGYGVPRSTMIGRDARSSSHYFDGLMDEVRVWNVARSYAEILESMWGLVDGTEAGHVAYWPFEEGSGTFTADAIGENDGTLVGPPTWMEQLSDLDDNDLPDECDPDCNTNGYPDGYDIQHEISMDFNGNDIPDECEPDCNTNGLPDDLDILEGISEDENGNGVPDECDVDCNSNGQSDDLDIAMGTSEDCNGNAVPDECDIAEGVSSDCNDNGVPDECDIAEGASADCNGNGVPDECDVAAGTGSDCNGNGVLDVCDISAETSRDCNVNGWPDECEQLPSGVIYVDDDAAGASGDGSSWGSATADLGAALSYAACSGDVYEVRVAGGVYRPDGAGLSDPRVATFVLSSGLVVRGGYAGMGAADPDERDCVLYETVLTGDLEGNDEADWVNRGDNCHHVVTASGVDNTGELVGFTVRSGYAWGVSPRGDGGGMYVSSSSLKIRDCVFVDNMASYAGAMYIVDSDPVFTNCQFLANKAMGNGGAMMTYGDCSVGLYGCNFVGNWASSYGGAISGSAYGVFVMVGCEFVANTASGEDGGGAYIMHSDSLIAHCVFNSNVADSGAGLCNYSSSPTLINCSFVANRAASRGGGVYNQGSRPTLVNCTFVENYASGQYGAGGGVFNHYSFPRLSNCALWGNVAASGPQIYDSSTSGSVASYCCVEGALWPGDGNVNGDPMFVVYPDSGGDGWGDDPGTAGVDESVNDDFGDLRLSAGSPCIDAGSNGALPVDSVDVDGDGDVGEQWPWDLGGGERFVDDLMVADTGVGVAPIVDIGAYEYPAVLGDCNSDGRLDDEDVEKVVGCMSGPGGGAASCSCADLDVDGDVDLRDFGVFQGRFGVGR